MLFVHLCLRLMLWKYSCYHSCYSGYEQNFFLYKTKKAAYHITEKKERVKWFVLKKSSILWHNINWLLESADKYKPFCIFMACQ